MTTSSSSFYQQIRSLPPPVWTLAAGSFVDKFGTFVFPFLVLFLTAEGLSKELAGLGVACIGVGCIGAAFLGGYLSDRIGRRRTIAVSMFGGAALALCLYASTIHADLLGGYWAAFLFAGLYGLIRGLYHSAASSLLADVVPSEQRVAGFAILRFAINGGWALGMLAAGVVAEYSFFLLFAIDAATSLIYGTVAILWLPHGVRTEKHESGWGKAMPVILKDRMFLVVLVNVFLGATIFTQWLTSFPVFLGEAGFKPSTYGLVMALNGFLIIVFEIPLSGIARKFRPTHVLAFGSILCGLGFALNGFAGGFGWLAAAMIVFTVGEMIAMPIQGSYVSQLAPEKMRGRYNGLLVLMWSTGHVVAPVMGLALLDLGSGALFYVMALLGLAGAGVLSLARYEADVPTSAEMGAEVEYES